MDTPANFTNSKTKVSALFNVLGTHFEGHCNLIEIKQKYTHRYIPIYLTIYIII